jgi:nitroimidazol reductase NimA-like FMN-containing flavoprotein (pyridoxamine 5'-phosphate oxidase superfamily)
MGTGTAPAIEVVADNGVRDFHTCVLAGELMKEDEIVRAVIDANQYLVLGTADAAGRPWTTPVYFAHEHYREFFWVSAPDRTHSQNLILRPSVAMVIFDSQARINTGQGVYIAADANQADDAHLAHAVEIFSTRCQAHGGRAFDVDEVTGRADLRMYHAVADQLWILAKDGGPDRRIPVEAVRPS